MDLSVGVCFKRAPTLFVTVMLFLLICCGFALANTQNAKVFLNGKELTPDANAPIFIEGRMLLPMRQIFEALDVKVSWDGQTKTIIASKGDLSINLGVGRDFAIVNGKNIDLDIPSVNISGTTFVPLRFIAETLGIEVSWDGENQIVRLEEYFYLASKHPLLIGDKRLYIGQSEKEIIKLLGEPSRKDLSEQGFTWYIYNTDYKNYFQIRIKDGRVFSVYTNAACFKYDEISFGKSEQEIIRLYPEKVNVFVEQLNITSHGTEIVLFLDVHDNRTVRSILLNEKDVDYMCLFENTEELNREILKGWELQLFDLENTNRVRHGVHNLKWSDDLAEAAREHSTDMIERDFFEHINPSGEDPNDRLKKKGLYPKACGASLAAGYVDAIYFYESWMNSLDHRKNNLDERYEFFGAGIALKPSYYIYLTSPVVTLHYFTPK